jgi:hypothetical protein
MRDGIEGAISSVYGVITPNSGPVGAKVAPASVEMKSWLGRPMAAVTPMRVWPARSWSRSTTGTGGTASTTVTLQPST